MYGVIFLNPLIGFLYSGTQAKTVSPTRASAIDLSPVTTYPISPS